MKKSRQSLPLLSKFYIGNQILRSYKNWSTGKLLPFSWNRNLNVPDLSRVLYYPKPEPTLYKKVITHGFNFYSNYFYNDNNQMQPPVVKTYVIF